MQRELLEDGEISDNDDLHSTAIHTHAVDVESDGTQKASIACEESTRASNRKRRHPSSSSPSDPALCTDSGSASIADEIRVPRVTCPVISAHADASNIDATAGEEVNESIDTSQDSVSKEKRSECFSSDEDSSTRYDNASDSDALDVDALLEKGYEIARADNPVDAPEIAHAVMREKVVLEHRGADYFDVLPDGWIEITHRSGLPVFLHKGTRVCTFSRPYFIGPGSVRNHNVPISAIPCLHQRRVRDEIEQRATSSLETNANYDDSAENKDERARRAILKLAPDTKVQTSLDFQQRQMDATALRDYAQSVFRFKTIKVYRFDKWSATRSFHKQKKQAEAERLGLSTKLEINARPSCSRQSRREFSALPANVKLITVPSLEKNTKPQQKSFFLNPQGKTSVSILHEYVQKILKSTILYTFVETRNASEPYGCTAKIKSVSHNRDLHAGGTIKEKLLRLQEKQKHDAEKNGVVDDDFVVLGSGFGTSKKAAKLESAKRALEVLIPGIEFDSDGIAATSADGVQTDDDAVALFGMLPITDSRIPELSAKAGQPPPYHILQECLKRNAAYGDTEIDLSNTRVKHHKHMFALKVGTHTANVICANKKEGKQKASQEMLKQLHPQIDTWGSLIRLYGHAAQRKLHETRKKRESIIKLQGVKKSESAIEPNLAILEKLRLEMDAVYAKLQEEPSCSESAATTSGLSVASIDI